MLHYMAINPQSNLCQLLHISIPSLAQHFPSAAMLPAFLSDSLSFPSSVTPCPAGSLLPPSENALVQNKRNNIAQVPLLGQTCERNREMDGGGQHKRHMIEYYKPPPWNMIPQYQIKEQNAFHVSTKIGMLCDEKDAAIQERDRALAEKKAALDDRDIAIQQRDAAIAERDNALRERDNAIAALQFHENTMNALFSRGGPRGPKRSNHPTKSARSLRENCITDAFPITAVPSEATAKSDQATREVNKNVKAKKSTKSPKKIKKIGEDLNLHVTTDGSKAEWDAQEFGSISPIRFDESIMPGPFCSCTGVPRHCYKWGNGGWQSACCTTSLSLYPLPQVPNKKHGRMGGRKMSGSVFSRLLTRLAVAGHDLSIPVDLKSYWAKHGTNRYITIK